jgi:hypothetical protein
MAGVLRCNLEGDFALRNLLALTPQGFRPEDVSKWALESLQSLGWASSILAQDKKHVGIDRTQSATLRTMNQQYHRAVN